MPSSPSPPRPAPPPSAYKHFCRVCNKGFTCGSALGGHMRAHAVADDGLGVDDDDEPVLCARGGGAEDGPSTATTTSTTHVYALRANPTRLTRGCQVCKNCGEEFSSMELFLQHGKCNPGVDEEADGSPPSVAEGVEDASLANGWSKGKRSRRAKLLADGGDDMPATSTAPSRCPSGEDEDEEEDLANCLVMLSSCKADQAGVTEGDAEPSASARKEHGRVPQQPQPQPISFIMPPPNQAMMMPLALPAPLYASPVPRGMFECKACKKVFTSHQALGGHRASHKKVKGCFAAKAESSVVSEPPHNAPAASGLNDDKGGGAAAVDVNASSSADAAAGETRAGTSEAAPPPSLSMAITTTDLEPPPVGAMAIAPFKKKAKMHECSVCHRLFSSGQALGGHKRCHWLTSGTGDHANIAALTAEGIVAAAGHQLTLRPMVDSSEPALDLTIAANLPLAAITSARATEVGTSSLHLDASAPSLYPQPAEVPSNPSLRDKMAAASSHDVNDGVAAAGGPEDEADSTTVKKARLSDLKDESTSTTPWLQVGIGSSSPGGDGKSAAE